MISLSTSGFHHRSSAQIAGLRTRAEGLQTQIATGERLTRGSDDPVAAARLRRLDQADRLAFAATRNSASARADLTLTDSTLGEAANLVIRARELAVQAASGSLNDTQRAALGKEVEGLRESLLLLANSRSASGHALFGGQASGEAYAAGPGPATYVGTAAAESIDIGGGQSIGPRVTGPQAFAFTAGAGSEDLFAVLADLADALGAGGPTLREAGAASLALLDRGLESITGAQSLVGVRLAVVELADERRSAADEAAAAERARSGGTDIATSMTRLQHTLTVLEATQAGFVRLANLSLFSLLR